MATDIVVPEMGESIVDARVAKWFKKEGDPVVVGEPLVELETDKVDIEVAAPQSGTLARIAFGQGSDVKIGDVLGAVAEGSGAAAGGSYTRAERSYAAAEGSDAGAERSVPATPSARKAARESKIDIAAVTTSGPRVTRDDVAKAARPAAPAPVAPGTSAPAHPRTSAPAGDRSESRERMSKRRATIAKRLLEVQSTAAMLTTFNEVDMSAVQALRARQKESFSKKYGVGLGLSSFFVKAAVAALREFPRLNAEIQGDDIVLKHYYDIGMAVSAAEGLVVPVVRDADRKSFAEIEAAVRGFAAKANDGTLALEDLRGGTFTITNGGVFGSLMSTPILNPPQVGILGLHAIKERPVGVNGQIVLRPMMYTALTYDHRIVDGAEAVRFLVRVKELIEDPGVLLVEL
ncbi:MAG: 2-oxoglutarate dehydrogenase complex dihydrolipoyllysine-residue succinyltransferase [Acidobacteria bacterium]|nr:MAG: 2-oxoglutarate dehydrogenase complex dihydrolipoyllysine-residue succinyltransferase [Acidobacteriota bacterium]